MNLPSNNCNELQRWREKPNICHRVQASAVDECLTAVSVRVLVMDGGDNVIPGTDSLQQDFTQQSDDPGGQKKNNGMKHRELNALTLNLLQQHCKY